MNGSYASNAKNNWVEGMSTAQWWSIRLQTDHQIGGSELNLKSFPLVSIKLLLSSCENIDPLWRTGLF